MTSIIKKINLNVKNIPGWRTNRKIVVFSVDDYGNVRLSSKQAKQKLEEAGLMVQNGSRFDRNDGLDTPDDLTLLFETLTSVKDKNGRNAVFTPFACCTNIDFEAIKNNNFDKFRYELLPVTLNKLPGYETAWQLWKEGLNRGIFIPQFHGREHLNVKLFDELLIGKDEKLIACINNNSYSGMPLTYYKTIKYNEAFSFDKFEENKQLKIILADGLKVFEKVFGYKASNFNAPGSYEHQILEPTMAESGIKYIDSIVVKKEHQGDGLYKNRFRYFGKRNVLNQIYLIRNCVFEPTLVKPDEAIASCINEIETAFYWNKPANVSSHRVNFTGVIDEENRKIGIDALKKLLKTIISKWPDVEFMAANELGDIISSEGK